MGLAVLVGAVLLAAPGPPARADAEARAEAQARGDAQAQGDATDCPSEDAFLSVLQVEGRLDEVLVDFVHQHVADLDASCAVGLLLQVDSSGVSDVGDALDDLVGAMEDATKPIEVWVGPTGSRATDEAVRLLTVADRTGVAAPGSRIEVTRELAAARGVDDADLEDVHFGELIGGERAVELDLVDTDTSVVVDFIGQMEVVETRVVGEGDDAERQPVTPTVFAKLPLAGQLMHTVASPAVAYLLFVIGLALLLFEMYSAGVGIAGMVGAGCVVLGCYGLASLPTSPIGVALLLLAAFGYAVDVQTGVPRLWTAIATVTFVLGSMLLFDGVSLSWITLLIAFALMSLFMLRGMPVMVRSRFSSPTIDREWLVGESGTATSAIASEGGTVSVRGAPWAASVNDNVGIDAGQQVRVVALDGFSLTVEPDTEGDIDTERAD